jgi:sulfite exporter TauE/SafE
MTLPPAYAQVLSLGVLWTSIHCIGMCGPLLSGFDIAGVMRGRSRIQGVLGVLSYQAGRSLTYAWLGSLAGLLGAGLGRIATVSGAVLALLAGALLLFSAMRSVGSLLAGLGVPNSTPLVALRTPKHSLSATEIIERVLTYSRRAMLPLLASRHPLREVALGAMMGLLPCMIPAWALSQAALTGSPFHGALVMLLLVGLTTPVLLLAAQLPRILCILPAIIRNVLAALLPAVSGAWLLLVGGAGLGLWPHAHLGVSLAGRPFLMMLF